jgi:hypothetical protein
MWMALRRAGLNTFADRSWPAGRTLPITALDYPHRLRSGANDITFDTSTMSVFLFYIMHVLLNLPFESLYLLKTV